MPAWNNDPTQPVQMLLPGVPAYSAGTPPVFGPPTRSLVTKSAVATNVVTLTVQMVEGNIPAVGDLIYVYATANNAGALNTTIGIAISAVSITALTGVGTISYPKTTGNLAATADVGYCITVPQATAEAVVGNQGYKCFAIPKRDDQTQNRSFTVTVSFPSAPAAISWDLQGAMDNIDADYVALIKGETAAGTASDSGAPGSSTNTQFWPGSFNFVRYKDTGSSGGSTPTVIAKILMM